VDLWKLAKNPNVLPVVRICLLYILLGILWIAFSDRLLSVLVSDPIQLTVLQTYKGWFYVAGTGILLFFLLSYEMRVRAQAIDLLEQERKFVSAVVNTASALVYVVDLEGRIIKFNRACQEITGYTFTEVKNIPFWDLLVNLDDMEAFKQVYEDLKSTNAPFDYESYLVTRDGRRRLISWSNTVLLDNAGNVEFVIGTGIDITERNTFEKELKKHRDHLEELVTDRTNELIIANEQLKQEISERKRSEAARKQMEKDLARLERLNLIGEMAAGIAHEIRNPMTTVRGFLQVFQNKDEFSQFREYVDLMIKELDGANAIISEYLYLAKDKVVDVEKLNLNTIIGAMLPLMQADAINSEKFVNLELTELPDFYANDKDVRQLILNLVRNGLEAMSPGGILTIKTFTDGEEIVLAVQDQGTGIAPEVVDKLGIPFFTTKDQGTGLGLAVCYSIAARYNAVIKLDTSSAGTTFYVRFRRQKAFV